MQSDTIIGIAGAVVLVAVMVGVFAYEYNNEPDAPELTAEEQAQMAFEENYANLDASQDLDGDGIANAMDSDMDGDGVDDAEDDMIKVVHDVSGSVGVSTPLAPVPGVERTLEAGTGIMHVELSMSSAAIVSGDTTGALSVTLTDPDGTRHNVPPTADGDTIVYSVSLDANVFAGEYVLSINHGQNVGNSTSWSGELMFHYDA